MNYQLDKMTKEREYLEKLIQKKEFELGTIDRKHNELCRIAYKDLEKEIKLLESIYATICNEAF